MTDGGVQMMVASGLAVALLLVGAAWLFGRDATDPRERSAGPALAVLESRFARGEIDTQEFRQIKQDLLQ